MPVNGRCNSQDQEQHDETLANDQNSARNNKFSSGSSGEEPRRLAMLKQLEPDALCFTVKHKKGDCSNVESSVPRDGRHDEDWEEEEEKEEKEEEEDDDYYYYYDGYHLPTMNYLCDLHY